MGTDNIILYAIYKKEITLTFIDYNGEEKTTRTERETAYNKNTTVTIEAPEINRYTGWTAKYWTTGTEANAEETLANGGTIENASENATYYARYTQSIEVSFNLNEGEGETPETIRGDREVNSYDVNTIINPEITMPETNASKVGYEFGGWNTQENGEGTNYTAGTKYDFGETTILYAKWTQNEYTVEYNGNGATGGSTESSTHIYDEAKELTANGYVREYEVRYNYNGNGEEEKTEKVTYTFNGWNTQANGEGTSYGDRQTVENLTETIGGTVTLYAMWNPSSVTLPTPEREGYTLKGWSEYKDAIDEEDIMLEGDIYTVTKSVTLYAIWEKIEQYTITVSPKAPDGDKVTKVIFTELGEGGSGVVSSIEDTELPFESIYTAGANVKIAVECELGYWVYEVENANGEENGIYEIKYNNEFSYASVVINEENPKNKEVILNLKRIEYTVEYYTDKDTLYETEKYLLGDSTDTNLEAPEREGYTFDGWHLKLSNGGVGEVFSGFENPFGTEDIETYFGIPENSTNPTEERYTKIELIAGWTPIQEYTVTFDANGGTGEIEAQTVTSGEEIELPREGVTREGYSLRGWSENSNAIDEEEIMIPGDPYTVTKSVTLYAIWEDVRPIITMDITKFNNKEYIIVQEKTNNNGERENYTVNDLLTEENFPNTNYIKKVYDSAGQEITGTDAIGSGARVDILNQSNEVVLSYILILRGDIDGNGTVNLYDITLLIELRYGQNNKEWTDITKIAGWCATNNDRENGTPNLYDITRLIEYRYKGRNWD